MEFKQMWEFVEVWHNGHEAVFGPFQTNKEAAEQCHKVQMPWSDDVIDYIIIRRVKE
jgi:hypothetical protein